MLRRINRLPNVVVGLEWPSTRPGEGAQRCLRFGIGMGVLEMALVAVKAEYHRVSPQLWKGRLGLPGKTGKDAVKQCYEYLQLYYPEADEYVCGPRGGIKDGLVDALLIAHFLRMSVSGGLRSVIEQYGRDSPQAMAMILRSGKSRKKKPLFS